MLVATIAYNLDNNLLNNSVEDYSYREYNKLDSNNYKLYNLNKEEE